MVPFGLPLILPALIIGALAGVFPGPANAFEPAGTAWPDTPATRRAAQGLVETLNTDLLANASATLTLERWCATHRIADPAVIRAERLREAEGSAPAEVRALLAAAPDTPVRHRRVRLNCGAVTLSEADNYYLPGRLTPEMNAQLDGTDTPFGKVVRELDFRRRTLEQRLLWIPADFRADEPRESAPTAVLAPPQFVLRHRAVLTLPDDTPFSALIERYTSGVLAFPAP